MVDILYSEEEEFERDIVVDEWDSEVVEWYLATNEWGSAVFEWDSEVVECYLATNEWGSAVFEWDSEV